jgi:hypothetical protein
MVTETKIMTDETSVPRDGRQSERALAVQRGTLRALRLRGFLSLPEFALASGRRMDLLAVGPGSEIWGIEIKSSLADFRSDLKWPDYLDWCERLYFAIPADMPMDIIPQAAGLVVADAHGAEFLRDPAERPLSPARRKAIMLRFARMAAQRLHDLSDPAFRISEDASL